MPISLRCAGLLQHIRPKPIQIRRPGLVPVYAQAHHQLIPQGKIIVGRDVIDNLGTAAGGILPPSIPPADDGPEDILLPPRR